MKRLRRGDYALPANELAPRLIGMRLVRTFEDGSRLSGVIVETEAYLGPHDRAAHCFGGRRTPRNESMYARPGVSYVYFTYGMHHCFNVVCAQKGEPAAVLIRALAPVEGRETMRLRRASVRRGTPLRDRDLCSGPGKLCQALAIDRALDGIDLTRDPRLMILDPQDTPGRAPKLEQSARIGVGSAGEWAAAPLRWTLKGSPHVSRK